MQRTNTEVLADTLKTLIETDNVATDITHNLEIQSEQINKMHDTLADTEISLAKSDKKLQGMTRWWWPWKTAWKPIWKKDKKRNTRNENKMAIKEDKNLLFFDQKSSHKQIDDGHSREDKQLDELLVVLDRLHDKGKDINKSLTMQNAQLNDLGHRIQLTDDRIVSHTEKVNQIS